MRTDERDRNDVTFLHVVGARLNRNTFFFPDIHLADEQMIGIGIGHEFFNAPCDDLFQPRICTHDVFYGHPRHRVFIGQFFRRLFEIYIVVKPFDRYLHKLFPPCQN